MKKIFCLTLFFAMLVASTISVGATSDLDRAVSRSANYISIHVKQPIVGSVGGEWAVIGLARSNHSVSPRYFERYFLAVERHVKERGGVLDERRLTENSRVILALTATGYNPRNIGGFDLTLPLMDFERVTRQGLNGTIFALMALESAGNVPLATRELYVNEILRRQVADGGWNLTGNTSNADITGMALQALAKYQDSEEVSEAIDRALVFLSRTQNECGGFSGGFAGSATNVESAVQILVALAELEIPFDDPRFVKNGNSVVDNVLSFQNRNGSFRHTLESTEGNLMSTEAGLYGLATAQRVGKKS
jgi:hypothetical protein